MAVAVRPTASAYFRKVSTEATTTRASMARISMPTRETLAHASTTIPLSRIRSTTSARLLESIVFCTVAILLLSLLRTGYTLHSDRLVSISKKDAKIRMNERSQFQRTYGFVGMSAGEQSG